MSDTVQLKLDDLTRRLRALEDELEQLRQQVAEQSAQPTRPPLLSDVHALVETGDLISALQNIALLDQPAHAIELLELARRRARDANSVPALREVVRVANAIAAGNRGGRRQAALQIGHAAEESIRRLEPPERDLVSQASLDGLEHARAQALAEGRSNQGIGKALFLSPKTVETHIHAIFQKLGLEGGADDHRRVLAVLAYLTR